jgi:tRNA (mo5U34)-methyltransferase
MSRAELIERAKQLKWYHKIALGDGFVTPGYDYEPMWIPILNEMNQVDYKDKVVLDLGSWDGMWAFEAERRGAREVWASDILTLRPVSGDGPETFHVARQLLASKVNFRVASVYDCDSIFGLRSFDIVQCFGIVYHLRYPLLGMAKIRKVLKDGGALLLETAVILDTEDSIIQTDFRKIYPTDRSTWNAFSEKALCDGIRESYFEVEHYRTTLRQDEELKIGRAFVRAKAVRGKYWHHFFPYPELEEYFAQL